MYIVLNIAGVQLQFKAVKAPIKFDKIVMVMIIAIIITITLFKSEGYLTEHKCSSNWGNYKLMEIRTNQIKCWFLRRGEKPLGAE